MNISKREISSLVHSLRNFFKTFDKASKCLQIPLPKPKTEIRSTKSKSNRFVHYNRDNIEHPNRRICLSFRFGKTIVASFPSKSLSYAVISSYLQKFQTLTNAKITTYTRIDIKLQTSVKYVRRLSMWSAFTLNFWWDQSLFIFLRTCIVRLQCFLKNFASKKNLTNLFKEATINAFNACQRHRCANNASTEKKSFSWGLAMGYLFFRREAKIISKCYWRCVLSNMPKLKKCLHI